MAELTRILVLGATGYIGGSVLSELSQKNIDDRYTISALVRKPYQASILRDAGVNALIFKDLDDFDAIRDAAKDHDIIVAAASARHEGCARACLRGLGERSKAEGREMHYLHTSGASMIGDWPVTGDRIDTKTYSDVEDNIFEIERDFPDSHSPVRKVNQLVVELGEKEGVRIHIVAPPLIFGPGTGSFTLGFGQVHMMVQLALKNKQSIMIDAGLGIWTRIHILDLSKLYVLLVEAIFEKGSSLPSGKIAYYFAENGYQSWKSIAQRIGEAGKKIGAFETSEIKEITLTKAAEEFFDGHSRDAEGVLASNARTKADRARQVLGWNPTRGESEFLEEIDDVVTAMFQQDDE